MSYRVMSKTEGEGSVLYEIEIDASYACRIEEIAEMCYAIESTYTGSQRGQDWGKAKYVSDFILSKAVNDLMEDEGVIAAATPQIMSPGMLKEGQPHSFSARVYPKPEAFLTSCEPLDLRSARIPAPGQSLAKVSEGDGSRADGYVSDRETALLGIAQRLVANIPKDLLDRAVQEYGTAFSLNLQRQGSSIEKYCSQMNINERHFSAYMTTDALKALTQNLALDAYFDACGLSITKSDVRDALKATFSQGEGAQAVDSLMEVYILHGDMQVLEGKARRNVALSHLIDTAVR